MPRRDDALYWVACEGASARAVTRYVRKDLGVDRRHLSSVGYWSATGAGIDGTMSEVGGALGVAVLGAVLNARFLSLLPLAAASFPAALAAAGTAPQRAVVTDAFARGLATGQLAGAAAVLLGGLLTAVLLHRAGRHVRPAGSAASAG